MSVFYSLTLIALAGLALLLLEAFDSKRALRYARDASLGLCLFVALRLLTGNLNCSSEALPSWVSPWLSFDPLAQTFVVLGLVSTALVLALLRIGESYIRQYTLGGSMSEFYAIPMIMAAAIGFMAAARDLVTVFVALELVTVSFYVLVSMARKSALCLEAGVKYLILGAMSTGVLVFGMAWIYGVCGTLEFSGIASALADPQIAKAPALLACGLMIAALGFKVAAAPFHVWVPDVYQGAPLPISAFLSVGSKAAGFVVLCRLLEGFLGAGSVVAAEVRQLLVILGGLTVLLGALPALHQSSVKRLLGFSSVSHAGFMILGLSSVAPGVTGTGLASFYLATYLPMTVLAFTVLTVMRAHEVGDDLSEIRGLSKRSPMLAFCLTVSMACLAGLPLSVGFLGKWLVLLGLAQAGQLAALVIALIAAACGFYYYFRPIVAAYSSSEEPRKAIEVSIPAAVLLVLLCAVVLVLGLYPAPLNGLLQLTGAPAAAALLR